ncbi:Thrombospondin type 3 repeat-containing protein [Mariniphaga anaerophila]|uniref:Thrombospondin type 3 repeat-containing protein n=1 Tax=Mariniphaga anaerophila TaxID=1484053 RepID=A0A1M5EU79_9BACT|nr:OmpA family protein [Mariniphaga anaerophila]SHF82774.1 Thrombospondin type 3 repeat-containing protein [Mariniphaga anaerophila]
MKRFTFLFLSFLIIGTAFAQNAEKKWALGLGPGLSYNLETENLGFLGEFYISRYLSPTFDLRLKTDAGFYDEGVDFVNPSLDLRLKLFNGKILSETSAIQPYLYGGVGYLFDNLDENGGTDNAGVNFNAGVGSKFPISPNTSLYLEAGYIHGIDGYRHVENTLTDVHDNFFKLSGIIEFAFGAAKDSDGDGVPDRKDKCPNTPPGVQVDENGCPLDRDGDGVPDYKDDCPDEAGDPKLNGCPDRDGDGIADKDDDCPDEPGLAKFNGCPDSDGDGVPDNKDKCPDTPKGCPVDADGCPLDSDGDGVIDCQDKCPTVPGPASNDGCPDEEKLEIPAIYFDFDKAELRPESKAELDKLVETLSESREYNVVVGGHTCNIGASNYNMKLSEKRAQSVVKYLLSKGISNTYVGSHYYGEDNPAVPNTSIDNRRKNRRVEFEEATIKK